MTNHQHENPNRYYGSICKKHPSLEGERYISDNHCIDCQREKDKRRRQAKALRFAQMPAVAAPLEIDKNDGDRGEIYFIGYTHNDGPIKIGFSINKENRLKKLQVAQPYPIKILAKFKGTRHEESLLHRFFQSNRTNGEWFSRTDNLLKIIYAFNRGHSFSEVDQEFGIATKRPKRIEQELDLEQAQRSLIVGMELAKGNE